MSPESSMVCASLKVCAFGASFSAASNRSGFVSQTAESTMPDVESKALLCSSPMAPYANKPVLISALDNQLLLMFFNLHKVTRVDRNVLGEDELLTIRSVKNRTYCP